MKVLKQNVNRNGSMDKNSNFSVDISDSFFTDFDDELEQPVENSEFTVKQPSGEIDILKQSLQAANITADDTLGFSESFDSYCFDGDALGLNLDSDKANDQSLFDTSQYLNLGNAPKPFQDSNSYSSSNDTGQTVGGFIESRSIQKSVHASHQGGIETQAVSEQGFCLSQITSTAGTSNQNASPAIFNSEMVRLCQQPMAQVSPKASINQQNVVAPAHQLTNPSLMNKNVVIQDGEQKIFSMQTLNMVSSSNQQAKNNFTVVVPANTTRLQSKASSGNNQLGSVESLSDRKFKVINSQGSHQQENSCIAQAAFSKSKSQIKIPCFVNAVPITTPSLATRTSNAPTTLRPIKSLQAKASPFVGMRIARVSIPISNSAASTQGAATNGIPSITHKSLEKSRQLITMGTKPTAVRYVLDGTRKAAEKRPVPKVTHQKILQQPAGSRIHAVVKTEQVDSSKVVKRAWNGNAYTVVGSANSNTLEKMCKNGPQGSHVSFRVDPGLTIEMMDHVQKVIRERSEHPVKKFNSQQQQLYSSFWAHILNMEKTVQEYYIRNPQLFTQKVYQHFSKTQKPFFVFVKNATNQGSSVQSSLNTALKSVDKTSNHPTISLTGSTNRTKSPVPIKTTRTTYVPGGSIVTHTKAMIKEHPNQVPVRLAVKRPIASTLPPPSVKNEAVMSATAVDSSIAPPKKPTLIQEQMKRHQELALRPDTATPFKNIRDCVRRLLPYHVFNVPEVKEADFNESEVLFGKIANQSYSRMHKMYSKYHQLLLKDTVRGVSSPDAVMLDRIYLQDERQKFMREKHSITENPYHLIYHLKMDDKRERSLADFLKDEARRKNEQTLSSDLHQQNPAASVENEALLQQAVNSIL